MYKINLIISSVLMALFSSCDVDFFPIDQVVTDEIISNPELLLTAVQGNYASFKASRIGGTYERTFWQEKEFKSDDIIMMRWSSDNFSYALTYQPISISNNAREVWQNSYAAIFGINRVIEAIENMDDEERIKFSNLNLDQILGENYWMRGMFHFNLVVLFGRPFSHDDPGVNLGIPLARNTNDLEDLPRASIKETYEFIESDLLYAAELMESKKSNIYASKEVAYATLARLYLYMEENQKALEYAEKVINSGRYSLVESADYPEFYTLGPERNPETIFAVKIRSEENRGKGSIGTMMNLDGGWGEIMASSTYLDLLNKNRNDLRWEFISPDFKLDANGNKIPDNSNPYYGYVVNDRMGSDAYFQMKQTGENGESMLFSPIYFRLAEMYLIRAEAYAKMGLDEEALEDVNIIRQRAGLAGDQLFDENNLGDYDSILDIVLDEKRLEFVFEGHRAIDVFRNKKTLDRSYMSWQGWSGPSSISYTSNRIVHQIPEDEIVKNPNLKQNPSWE